MKHLFIILFIPIAILSCKKEPIEKSFLYGRLIDNCNGNPVANQKVDFYQNFKKSSNPFLVPNTEELLLETVTTDDDGNFYFLGEDYMKETNSAYPNSSIRLNNTNILIADGSLGKHYKAEAGIYSHQNVGDLLLDGMEIGLNIQIANHDNSVYFDSVSISGLSGYFMLTSPSNDWFDTTINNINLSTKAFFNTDDVNDEKYEFNLILYFYNNGTSLKKVKTYYFSPCITFDDIVFEF